MFEFLFRITGVAFFDGINPTIILITLYILAGKNAVKRVPVYLLTIYLTNLLLGVFVYFFVGIEHFDTLFKLIGSKNIWVYAVKVLLSTALLVGAYRIDIHKTREIKSSKTKKEGMLPVFLLGLTGTVIEFSTAASYVVGLRILAKRHPDDVGSLLVLGYYNFIYILIPLVMYIVFILNRPQAEDLIKKMHAKTSFYLNHFFRVTFVIIGLVLVVDCASFFLRSPFLHLRDLIVRS
jgi:hypothetical protein